MLGSDEGIKLVLYGGKMIGNKIGNVYGNTLGLDVGTDLGYLDRYCDGSNNDKLEGLFLGYYV